jgi:multidrug efflux pump subunit AcrA (membrane-fusion protein)
VKDCEPLRFLCVVVLSVLIAVACSNSDQLHSKITFTTARSDLVITVEGEGELEAQRSHVLVVPMLRAQPTIAYLAQEGSSVEKGEVAVRLEAEAIEKQYLDALDEVEIAKAEAQKKEAELTLQRLLHESQLKSAEASLATATLQLAKLEFEAPTSREIKEVEIEGHQLEADRNRKQLASLKKIQEEERSHMQLKIKQAKFKVAQSERFLSQLLLKAPVDGIVVYERSWITGNKIQEGDALYPNMPVVKIPDLSAMQVKLKIGETDAQKLKAGQQASVRVPSLGDFSLPGSVLRVDRIAKPIKRGSKIKKVEVIVAIDSIVTDLVPGLSAECTIEIERFQDVLAVPRECIFERDSLKIVYVMRDGSFIPYPVASSQQTEDFVVIQSDLAGGEECALREPSGSLVKWPDNLSPYKVVVNSKTQTDSQ